MSIGYPSGVQLSAGSSIQPNSPTPVPSIGPNSGDTLILARGEAIPLIAGVQILAALTAPNDGFHHLLQIVGFVAVTTAETGGTIVCTSTTNGSQSNNPISPGGSGAGTVEFTNFNQLVDPGTTVQLRQSTVLSAGVAAVTFVVMFA